MSDCITIELPLPHEVLHPNGRTRNPQYRSRLVKCARGDAALVANHSVGDKFRPFDNANIEATFYMPRRRDDDGLRSWLKPYIDGIVADAGLVSNDSRVFVTEVKQVTGKSAGGKRGVVLRITERIP